MEGSSTSFGGGLPMAAGTTPTPNYLLRLYFCLGNCFYFLRLFLRNQPKIPLKNKHKNQPHEAIFKICCAKALPEVQGDEI